MKKSLYGILEVENTASLTDIEQAYKRVTENLNLKKSIIGLEEAQIQKKAIDMAYGILSNIDSRSAYDAKLISAKPPNFKEQKIELSVATDENKHSPLRGVLSVMAGVMVIWLSMQLIYLFIAYRSNHGEIKAPEAILNQAEEKLKVQQYYQEYGVRPGSGIEADMLRAEEQRKENVARKEKFEKSEQERKYQQWLAEGRRTGEEINRQRLQAEEQEKRLQERQKLMEEQQKRMLEESERRRINSERMRYGLRPIPR